MTAPDLAEQLEDTAALLRAHAPAPDALRALQSAANAITAAQAELVAEMTARCEHEAEGYASPKNWLRDQLRLDSSQANRLLDAALTFERLPRVAEEAASGAFSLEHVRSFAYALKHLDPDVVDDAQDWMLELAERAEPRALRNATTRLREVAHPEELDDAWIRGMDRHDVRLHPVGEGWHLTGFLPAGTGAKLHTVLTSLSAPTCANDDRPVAERRISALDALLSDVLASGLPTDKGVRPHTDLAVDLGDLARHPESTTATLAGFGTIGPTQLQEMLCQADLTPILTGGRHAVLDVGRAVRLGTSAQRRALNRRQDGVCAAPGCHGPVVHVHHVTYWSAGGPTDLANLIGLCPGCHTKVHSGSLTIDPTTHRFNRHLRSLRRSPRLPRAG